MPDEQPGRDHDVIVIGSGMGGLATASLLAQIGRRRVLVLESHFKLGGFLHSFRRHGYEWDPGLHYIGDMSDGALTRQCMDLVTGGRIQWHQLDDRFERFLFPDETFEAPSDLGRFERRLIERFPAEADGIRRYIRDVRRLQRWSQRWFYSKQFREPMATILAAGRARRLAQTTTKAYLDTHLRDPLLKAILTGQWPDYGSPPGQSAFGIHAIVTADFGGGGYYPDGGGAHLVSSAQAEIEKHGGHCLTRHRVERVLVENGRAVGVEVSTSAGRREFRAPMIVSDAGVATTFGQLVPPGHGARERARLDRGERGVSAIVLFLGLNDDPRSLGFEDCNYWVYAGHDHDRESDHFRDPPEILGAYLSFGSLRDPLAAKHAAQIITFSPHERWARFADRPWKRRGLEYEDLKDRFADALIDFVDHRLPGLGQLVAHRELSTPLTVESFTGHPDGQVYGRPSTPQRLGRDQWSIGTSLKGLYLTGTDVVVPGVNSALMIGVMAAGKLLGPGGTARIIHAARST